MGHSAINKEVTQEYTINIHEHTHGEGFKKHTPQAKGTSGVHADTRLIWSKGIRNGPHCILYACPEK
ncbi:60S ribosomal protein L31 [Lemmus lemmus]